MNRPRFQVKMLDDRAKLVRGSSMAAGYDVVACIDEPLSLRAGNPAVLVPLGFACFMDDGAVAGIVLPRSSLGHKHGLCLGNTAGVIDGDYQNQWFVSAWNRGQEEEIVIKPGDRLAQVLFVPVIHPEFVEVMEFSSVTGRGLGGFGSTGVGALGPVEDVIPRGSLGEPVEA